MYTHSGMYTAITKTIREQMSRAFTLRFLNTNGTSRVHASPMTVKNRPNMIAPFSIHSFSCRASSSSPLPSSLPIITAVAVQIPENAMKKRFAIAKLADMPETTSAPPLPLYSAVVTVSAMAHTISEHMIIHAFLKMSLKSFMLTRNKSMNRMTKGGCFFIM